MAFGSYAASGDDQAAVLSFQSDSGNGSSSALISEIPVTNGETITHQGLNYTMSEKDGTTIYTFEGKDYSLLSSYGVHKITGYTTEGDIGALTTSGDLPQERHTISASSALPLGTVILLKDVSGPGARLYEGIYVVEDRGGARIEQEGFLDIFFDTYAEAIAVTESGWSEMEAFILTPIS